MWTYLVALKPRALSWLQELLSTRLCSYEVSFHTSVQTAATFHEIKLLDLIEKHQMNSNVGTVHTYIRTKKNEKQAGISK